MPPVSSSTTIAASWTSTEAAAQAVRMGRGIVSKSGQKIEDWRDIAERLP